MRFRKMSERRASSYGSEMGRARGTTAATAATVRKRSDSKAVAPPANAVSADQSPDVAARPGRRRHATSGPLLNANGQPRKKQRPARKKLAERRARSFTAEDIVWLAGIMEGEGSFLQAAPSKPTQPIFRVEMTDEDVIQRVADLLDVEPQRLPARADNHKDSYRVTFLGRDACRLMNTLRPWMGARRQSQIDAALTTYKAAERKLTFAQAEEIRALNRDEGLNSMELGRRYEIDSGYIRGVLRGELITHDPNDISSYPVPGLPDADAANTGAEPFDFDAQPQHLKTIWLAAYLEGEGSFCTRRKKNGGQHSIQVTTNDEDVAHRAAALLAGQVNVRAGKSRDEKWNSFYRFQNNSRNAHASMRAVLPYMGQRRSATIQTILDSLPDGKQRGGDAISKNRP